LIDLEKLVLGCVNCFTYTLGEGLGKWGVRLGCFEFLPSVKVFHDLEKAQRGRADAEDKTERGVSQRGVSQRGGPSLWPDEEYHNEETKRQQVLVQQRGNLTRRAISRSEIHWLNMTEE
jgi:hypothetical protein